jgi:hypothetical protein
MSRGQKKTNRTQHKKKTPIIIGMFLTFAKVSVVEGAEASEASAGNLLRHVLASAVTRRQDRHLAREIRNTKQETRNTKHETGGKKKEGKNKE